MKKPRALISIVAGLLLITLLFSGCQSILVIRNGEAMTGETETRQFDFTEFTYVDIGSAFSYEIKQSDNYSISITANNNLFDDIMVTKEGQTLKIAMKTTWSPFNIGSERLKAVITMPELYRLDSSGATSGTVSDFSSTEDLNITVSGASSVDLVEIAAGDIDFDISGASNVDGTLKTEDINLDISGASSIQLEGEVSDIDIEASGASRLNLAHLTVNNANIVLSGASIATVNLKGRLDIRLSGASLLYYIGEPKLGTIDISGSSTLKEK